MEALALREWTREDYYRAAEAGVFRPDEKLELIDEQIVTKMSPQGKPHIICVLLIDDWLDDQIGGKFHVRTQMPLALGTRDEPNRTSWSCSANRRITSMSTRRPIGSPRRRGR